MKKLIALLVFLTMVGYSQAPVESAAFTRVNGTNSLASSYLKMLTTDFGNFDHGKYSGFCHFKRTQFGAHEIIWDQSNGSKLADADWSFDFEINAQDHPELDIFKNDASGHIALLARFTASVLTRDTNWHSIEWNVDAFNPVQTNRVSIIFDRVRQAPISPVTYPDGVSTTRQCIFPVYIGGNSTATNPAEYYFPGKLVNVAFFSGRNPDIDELTTSDNKPKDIDAVPNLWSLVRGDGFPVEQDEVLPTNWINHKVTQSGDVP